MNTAAFTFIEALGRTSLWLAAAALAAALVLRLARVRSPAVHRAAWLAALIVGWTFLRWPLGLPWYEPAPPASMAAVETPRVSPAASLDPIIELAPGGMMADPQPAPFDGHDAALPLAVMPLEPIASPGSLAPAAGDPNADRAADWHFDWRTDGAVALAALWLLGVIVIVARWVFGYARFVRHVRRIAVAEDRWSEAWRRITAEAGVRRPAGLRFTHELGPLVCRAAGRYELLVPAELSRELDDAQRPAILRHELAHLVRGDLWKSLAARVLALPHWFNPAAWWAVRRFDEAAEWACDLAATGDEPATAYARALVRIGETAGTRTAYGHAIRGRTLAARVRRLLAAGPAEDTRRKKVALAALAVCLVIVPLVKVELVAKEPAQSPEQDLRLAQTTRVSPASAPTTAGPTVSPYLNLLQDGEGPAQQSGEVYQTPEELVDALNRSHPAPSKELAAAQQKLVEAAKRGFETTQAAHQADTVAFEPVCVWSERWMEAALDAATTPAQRQAAVEAQLERMKNWQSRIHKLGDEGMRGGEANNMATVDYYVARAERRLAQVHAESFAQRMIRKGYAPPANGSFAAPGLAVQPQHPAGPIAEPARVQPATPTKLAAAPNIAARKEQRGIVEAARRAFDGAKMELDSGQSANVESACIWSERLAEAEAAAAQDPLQQRAAYEANLKRLAELHAKAKALAETGQGKREMLDTADYYVARGRERLASTQAPPAGATPTSSRRMASFPAEPLSSTPLVQPLAPNAADPFAPAGTPATPTPSRPMKREVPATPAPSQPRVPSPNDWATPAQEPTSASPLRYEGQTFEHWVAQAKEELSTERRIAAVRASAPSAQPVWPARRSGRSST